MKKAEAMQIAPEWSRLIIEYIDQILSDEVVVKAEIKIGCARVGNENMKTFGIYVPKKDFNKHWNTSITTQQRSVLDAQILDDLISNYLYSETIQISKFRSIKGSSFRFNGINIKGPNGTEIGIDFGSIDHDIEENYNNSLNGYANNHQGFKM